ncbi:hypothetical protein MMC09_002273 [Bachmanniomyces sp. S44760]|nr:hypothetical protein [Bachmanniomyces sp. S44760]
MYPSPYRLDEESKTSPFGNLKDLVPKPLRSRSPLRPKSTDGASRIRHIEEEENVRLEGHRSLASRKADPSHRTARSCSPVPDNQARQSQARGWMRPPRDFREPPMEHGETPRGYRGGPREHREGPREYIQLPREYGAPPRQYRERTPPSHQERIRYQDREQHQTQPIPIRASRERERTPQYDLLDDYLSAAELDDIPVSLRPPHHVTRGLSGSPTVERARGISPARTSENTLALDREPRLPVLEPQRPHTRGYPGIDRARTLDPPRGPPSPSVHRSFTELPTIRTPTTITYANDRGRHSGPVRQSRQHVPSMYDYLTMEQLEGVWDRQDSSTTLGSVDAPIKPASPMRHSSPATPRSALKVPPALTAKAAEDDHLSLQYHPAFRNIAKSNPFHNSFAPKAARI